MSDGLVGHGVSGSWVAISCFEAGGCLEVLLMPEVLKKERVGLYRKGVQRLVNSFLGTAGVLVGYSVYYVL